MASVGSVAAAGASGAAAGSVVPGIGTLVGGIAGVAGGLLGLIGSSNANAANAAEQQQAEQYNTEMADTAYQRAVADMKAAGINPMLAYMQGGESSPSAPMYTVQNTLSSFSSNASDERDAVQDFLDAQGSEEDNTIKAANANTAGPTYTAKMQEAQANATEANAHANVATASQQAAIQSNSAQASKAQADAGKAKVEEAVAKAGEESRKKVAPYEPYVDIGAKAAQGASSAVDAINIYKAIKNFVPKRGDFSSGPPGTYKPDGAKSTGPWSGAREGSALFDIQNNSYMQGGRNGGQVDQ